MAEAEIKTTSGATIFVRGDTEEVNEILEFWQKREEQFKHRRIYYRDLGERNMRVHFDNTPFFPTKKALSSPKIKILKLIDEGFFDEYRTLRETREKLQKKYERIVSNASLHPTLMSLIIQNKLIRKKQNNGLWGYMIENKKESRKEENGS